VSYQGQTGSFTHQMFLNDHPPIAGGRELWGFPKKLAQQKLAVEIDTLVGTLNYGSVRIDRKQAAAAWPEKREKELIRSCASNRGNFGCPFAARFN